MDFKIVAHTPVGVFTSAIAKDSIEGYSHVAEVIRESNEIVNFEDEDGNLVILKKDVLNASVFTICKIKE